MATSGQKSLIGAYAWGLTKASMWAFEVAMPAVVTAYVLKLVFEPKKIETIIRQR